VIDRKNYLKAYQKEWREKNKEYKKKKDKEYAIKNKEKIANYKKEYYLKNKKRILERNKEYQKKYRIENKEKLLKWNREYSKQYAKDNPEKVKNCTKKWKLDNKKHIREYAKQYNKMWNQTEKGQTKIQRDSAKRRAREREMINTLTSEEWLQILEDYDYRCAYCVCEFDEDNLPTRDHVIPISKGGHNIKENVVPACKSCNSKKRDKIIEELKPKKVKLKTGKVRK
jgi:5-methylcytosine-specific restriction endonuclease McrA